LVRIPLLGFAMLLTATLSPAAASTGSICLDACQSRRDACLKSAPEAGCTDAFHACRRKCYHMPWRKITPRPK
jgi:hypothetical protein